MKIDRLKKSHKILQYYALNFGYREPFQILIDATFCQGALQNKVQIDDQLRKYLQSELKILTTQCIILEAESLGSPLVGATQIVKKYLVHKCGHENNPITASSCILSMMKQSKYIIATQDRNLQQKIRKISGQALIYLHRATPVLEQISDATKKFIKLKAQQTVLSEETEIKLQQIRSKQTHNTKPKRIHNRKVKNPNPLSCKKKKTKKVKKEKII